MTDQTKNTIIGLVALLPLLTLLLFFPYFVWPATTIRIILAISISLSTCYGILKLAEPLAKEVEAKGKLI